MRERGEEAHRRMNGFFFGLGDKEIRLEERGNRNSEGAATIL